MPAGERIGQAYVRVILSGDNKQFLDDLANDPEWQGAGETGGKNFKKGFDKQNKKFGHDTMLKLQGAFEQGRGRFKAIGKQYGELFSSGLADEVRRTIDKEFGKGLGNLVVRDVFDDFLTHGSVDRLKAELGDLNRLSERAIKQQHMLNQQNIKDFEQIDALLQGNHRKLAQTNSELKDMAELSRRASAGLEFRDLSRMERFFAKRQISQFNRDLDRTNITANRLDKSFGRMGDTIGIAFGRGSRNNFLNFIGSVGRNMFNMISRTITGIIRMTTSFFKFTWQVGTAVVGAFNDAREAGAGFLKALTAGGIAGLQVGLAAITNLLLNLNPIGLITIAAGALAAAAASAVLVSALSLLLGIVTALASTITFALIGAVSSLVAILIPVGGIAIAAAAAFIKMDDASKAFLKRSFAPVAKELSAVGKAVRAELFPIMPELGRRIARVVDDMKFLARESAGALGKVALDFARAMESPGFQNFRMEMRKFLPLAIIQLGDTIRQTLGGIGGIFLGMIPFMKRVLDFLDRITLKFQNWANSPGGRNQIEAFFKKAGDSAKSFGEFLQEVIGLVGDLFNAGNKTGNNIFDRMTRGLAKFRSYITSNPDVLREWFNSAENFAISLGSLIKGVGKLMAALDSPVGRAAIIGLALAFGTLFGAIGGAATLILKVFGWLLQRVGQFIVMSSRLGAALNIPGFDKLKEFGEGLVKIGEGTNKLTSDMLGLGDAMNSTGDKGKKKFNELAHTVNQTRNSILLSQAGIKKYHDVLMGLPTRLVTLITTNKSAYDTKLEILALARQYNLTPKEVRTIVKLTGGKVTKKEAEEILARLRETGDFRGNPTINTGGITKAKDAVKAFQKALTEVKPPQNILDLPGFFGRLGDSLARSGLGKTKNIKVTDNGTAKKTKDNIASLNKEMGKLKGKDFKVKDGGSLRDLRGKAKDLKSTTDKLKDVNIKVKDSGTFKKFTSASDKLNDAMKKVDKLDPSIKVKDGDTFAKNTKKAKDLAAAIRSIDTSVTIRIKTIKTTENRGARGGLMQDGVSMFAKGGFVDARAKRMAFGGFANSQRLYGDAIIGESGKEAIVPLHRPLGQVDPSVRLLSAFAQGKLGQLTGTTNDKSVSADGWTIVSNSDDPVTVAAEVLNRLTAASY